MSARGRVCTRCAWRAWRDPQVRAIVDLQVKRVADRLKAKKMRLQLTDDALDFIAEVGYDPQYGARPVKRTVQSQLETLLAKSILKVRVRPALASCQRRVEDPTYVAAVFARWKPGNSRRGSERSKRRV